MMDRPLTFATDLLIIVTAHQQYQDGMRKRAEKANGSFNTGEQSRCVIRSAESDLFFQHRQKPGSRIRRKMLNDNHQLSR
jgi:hypothetical protein